MSHEDQGIGSPAPVPIQFPINLNFNFPPIPPAPVPPAPSPAVPGLPANTPEWITLFHQMLDQMQTIAANQAPAPAPHITKHGQVFGSALVLWQTKRCQCLHKDYSVLY